MRKLVSAVLCAAVFAAPVMAQEGGQTAETPAPAAQEVVETVELPAAETAAIDPDAPPAEIEEDKTVTEAPAYAGPVAGYTYFHRAGATLADQRADIDACRPAVLAMRHTESVASSGGGYSAPVYVPQSPAISPGAAAGAGVVLLLGVAVAADAAQRAADVRDMHLNYETCMVVRGWSVMTLDDETGRQLDRLNATRLAARLETMVGAGSPIGTVSRQFASLHRYSSPRDVDEMSLSLQIVPDSHFGERGANNLLASNTSEDRRRAREAAARERDREERRRVLLEGSRDRGARRADLSALEAMPENSAVILIGSRGPMLRLVRVGAQEGDGADSISIGSSSGLSAFVVPAGEWRLASLSTLAPATSNCLGAPVFRLNAGDVVFAGAFGSDGAPDLALDGARETLAAQPALAERLQPASYVNGSTYECGAASFVTAYEIAGAPFAEGYAWGSRANAAEEE